MRILGLNGIIFWLFVFVVLLFYVYGLYIKYGISYAVSGIIVFGAPAVYVLYRQIKDERMIKREHSRNT